MKLRPSLLMLTAAAAGLSAVSTAFSAGAAPAASPPETRLGASIQQDLTARDRASAQRNRQLDVREQAALAAERRLKAAAATAVPAPAAAAGATPTSTSAASGEDRFAELARIYQAMKPKAAAAVFEQLAMDVQVEVANRMRERSTAQIMAAMSPKGAASLTMAMARGKAGWTPVSRAAR